jgi:hypothetical protein
LKTILLFESSALWLQAADFFVIEDQVREITTALAGKLFAPDPSSIDNGSLDAPAQVLPHSRLTSAGSMDGYMPMGRFCNLFLPRTCVKQQLNGSANMHRDDSKQ